MEWHRLSHLKRATGVASAVEWTAARLAWASYGGHGERDDVEVS